MSSKSGESAFRGATWVVFGQVIQLVVRFGIIAVLARMLVPEDFGVAAIALLIVGAGQIVTRMGGPAALVRYRTVSSYYLNAVFWNFALISLVVLPAIIILSKVVGGQMGMPKLMLCVIVLLPTIFSDFISHLCTRVLHVTMKIGVVAKVELVGYILVYGVVSIAAAYLGFGVYSLLWAYLANSLFNALALSAIAKVRLGFEFKAGVYAAVFNYGSMLSVASILTYFSQNAPKYFVGLGGGAAAVGLYSRASDLSNRMQALVDKVAINVVFPALSSMSDDKERLALLYSNKTPVLFSVATFVATIISVNGPELVALLFGAGWERSGDIIKVLAYLLPITVVRKVLRSFGNSLGFMKNGVADSLIALGLVSAFSLLALQATDILLAVSFAVVVGLGASTAISYVAVANRLEISALQLWSELLRGGGVAFVVAGAYIIGEATIVVPNSWFRFFVTGLSVILIVHCLWPEVRAHMLRVNRKRKA